MYNIFIYIYIIHNLYYKIFIHEKYLEKENDKFSRPGIIDARARYRAAAQRLRNTDPECVAFITRFSIFSTKINSENY